MDEFILDDNNVDEIEWNDIQKVKHLVPTKTYRRLLMESDKYLSPQYVLSLDLDYESMKLLLKQAEEFEIPFARSKELKAIFILKNKSIDTVRKLLIEEGYGEPEQTATIVDYCLYRKICSRLEAVMDIDEIRKYRKNELNKLLTREIFLLELEIFPELYFFDQDNFYDERSNKLNEYEMAENMLLDLISNYFFDDYYRNVYLDIKQILKYIDLTNNDLIPQDRLTFYQAFNMLREYTADERIAFFKSYKNIDIMTQFYDDIRALKDQSYKSLVESCTQFTKDSSLYNKELSEQYGCEIYYLDGEEFFGFVRSDSTISKYDIDFSSGEPRVVECEQPTPERIARLGHSFTYIGKDDIQTFQHPNKKLTMLYRGIDYRTIAHVFHNDSWTSSTYEYHSDYQNELHTPDSLLRESIKYPEIYISELNGIEPFALICLDEVSEWDVKFAKKNNMPIVVINSLKYERKYEKEDLFVDRYRR
jgi:hypothetical protein